MNALVPPELASQHKTEAIAINSKTFKLHVTFVAIVPYLFWQKKGVDHEKQVKASRILIC